MEWEIVEVPGNTAPSLEDSTVDVVAANIEPKAANVLIRQLNQVCPLENLRHVKRVRRRTDCGKSALSIILCISNASENYCEGFPEGVQKIVDTYRLIPFTTKVAKCSAASKEEWEEQCRLWPTSYHPAHEFDVRGFRDEELPSIFNHMKTVIQLTKMPLNQMNTQAKQRDPNTCSKSEPAAEGNAAIIVDPSSNQIIAKAKDQTYHSNSSAEGNRVSGLEEDTCSLNGSTEKDIMLSSSCTKYNTLSLEVSCTNPWGWTKQKTNGMKPLPCQGCCTWHPLQHAAMVAIEKAAERDRMLFTSSSAIIKPISNGHSENYSDNEPAKRLKTDAKDKEQSAGGACCSDLSEATRPYLCTGFDVYLIWEPCAMCAMALVHQRLKRVFYAFPNPVTGALGGVYRLHGEKSLNHHYSVFRILVPESYLNCFSKC